MHLLLPFSALLLSAGAPPQEPDAGQPPLDGVVAIVGDEIITYSDLRYAMMEGARTGRRLEPQQILDQRVRRLLMTQAGQDFGYDPELVENLLADKAERIVDEKGGAVEASSFFAEIGLRPDQVKDYWRNDLYAQTFEGAITGKSPGPGGRVIVDRFIRPGQKYAAYRLLALSEDPSERTKVGAAPLMVVLQELILPIDQYGGEGPTMKLARSLRESILDGEAFAEIVQLHGAIKENDARTAPLTLPVLLQNSRMRHGDDSMARFVVDGAVGAVSEPAIGTAIGSERQAVFMYFLAERREASEPAPFADPDVQESLTKELEDTLDRRRVSLELGLLRKAIYVWTPDSIEGEGPPPVQE